jgi:hypothetical protein
MMIEIMMVLAAMNGEEERGRVTMVATVFWHPPQAQAGAGSAPAVLVRLPHRPATVLQEGSEDLFGRQRRE